MGRCWAGSARPRCSSVGCGRRSGLWTPAGPPHTPAGETRAAPRPTSSCSALRWFAGRRAAAVRRLRQQGAASGVEHPGGRRGVGIGAHRLHHPLRPPVLHRAGRRHRLQPGRPAPVLRLRLPGVHHRTDLPGVGYRPEDETDSGHRSCGTCCCPTCSAPPSSPPPSTSSPASPNSESPVTEAPRCDRQADRAVQSQSRRLNIVYRPNAIATLMLMLNTKPHSLPKPG